MVQEMALSIKRIRKGIPSGGSEATVQSAGPLHSSSSVLKLQITVPRATRGCQSTISTVEGTPHLVNILIKNAARLPFFTRL